MLDDGTEKYGYSDDYITTALSEYKMSFAVRVVYIIGGILALLLALRFVLSLFGAGISNLFARFIFDTSQPFLAPFFRLFNYRESFSVPRLEWYTLLAILVYAVATVLLVQLTALGSRRREV